MEKKELKQTIKMYEISTSAAIRKMILPSFVALLSPIIVGLYSTKMLAGLLVGVTASGITTCHIYVKCRWCMG